MFSLYIYTKSILSSARSYNGFTIWYGYWHVVTGMHFRFVFIYIYIIVVQMDSKSLYQESHIKKDYDIVFWSSLGQVGGPIGWELKKWTVISQAGHKMLFKRSKWTVLKNDHPLGFRSVHFWCDHLFSPDRSLISLRTVRCIRPIRHCNLQKYCT